MDLNEKLNYYLIINFVEDYLMLSYNYHLFVLVDNLATRQGYDRVLRCTGFKVIFSFVLKTMINKTP